MNDPLPEDFTKTTIDHPPQTPEPSQQPHEPTSDPKTYIFRKTPFNILTATVSYVIGMGVYLYALLSGFLSTSSITSLFIAISIPLAALFIIKRLLLSRKEIYIDDNGITIGTHKFPWEQFVSVHYYSRVNSNYKLYRFKTINGKKLTIPSDHPKIEHYLDKYLTPTNILDKNKEYTRWYSPTVNYYQPINFGDKLNLKLNKPLPKKFAYAVIGVSIIALLLLTIVLNLYSEML